MTELVVEVNGLSRQFGQTLALDSVDFQAARGSVYGLVGANGAGKTTLIKHLMGLLRSHSGSVQVFGQDPVRDPVSVLKRIGYLSEDRDIPEWMSIDELMRYTNAFHKHWDSAYAKDLLDTFSLDTSKLIKDLSRGMRAQVALVAAVAHRPDLLILDEPSSGLDAVVRQDILNAIVRTISEEGRTVIFSSHLLEEVERMSDHVVMIQQGQVVLDGVLETLCNSYRHVSIRFADQFDSAPVLRDVLYINGNGRSWSAIHHISEEQFNTAVKQLDGEVVESRNATLEEIFIARVGRSIDKQEAA
ncbi:MAG: ABC transporter ATP-binding protein [Gammaproteobacteria bacterium]|jgi:ABC-2 type transport system ATP-binding protein|nr:ABC transporter ATP-binding protein [Gammaproteobacteria bacterium]|tara:strand:- start:907 stop:1812 length:906 start_codon:yes stop_codon:yes gene_type:complete